MSKLTPIIENLETLLDEKKEITVQRLQKELMPILGKARVNADQSLLYKYTIQRDSFSLLNIKPENGKYAVKVSMMRGADGRNIKSKHVSVHDDLEDLKGTLESKTFQRTMKINIKRNVRK